MTLKQREAILKKRAKEDMSLYKDSTTEEWFDILQMYKGEPASPNGYRDAYYFRLVGFNTKRKTRRELGDWHDELFINSFADKINVHIFKFYADGSALLAFNTPVRPIVCTSSQAFEVQE